MQQCSACSVICLNVVGVVSQSEHGHQLFQKKDKIKVKDLHVSSGDESVCYYCMTDV